MQQVGITERTGWYPENQPLYGFASAMRETAASALRTRGGAEEIAHAHNAFANYTLALLFFATGHRPVDDPFCYRTQIGLSDRICLISDKVVDPSRAYRLVAFPKLAADQLEAYLEHLRALGHRLRSARGVANRKAVTAAARKIEKLCDEPGSTHLPLFFYLSADLDSFEKVGEKRMRLAWEKHWQAPVNVGRRVIATELRARGVSAERVMLQLGHQDALQHPLGRFSLSPAIAELQDLGAELDSILKKLGWEVLPGYSRYGSRNRPAKGVLAKGHLSFGKGRRFGPEKRAESRKKRLESLQLLVKQVREEVLGGQPPEQITAAHVEQLAQAVRRRAEDKAVSENACLRILYEWLRSPDAPPLARGERFRLRLDLKPEASPFGKNTVSDYSRVVAARQIFMDLLDTRGRAGTPGGVARETRLAEVVLAAALFDRIAHPDGYLAMGNAVMNQAFQLEELVFVELEVTSARHVFNAYRWYPSPFAQALLIGLQQLPANAATLDKQMLNGELRRLIDDVGLARGKRFDIDAVLEHAALSSLAVESPGFVRAVITGDLPYRTLPLDALVRMISRQPLLGSTSEAKASDASTPPECPWRWRPTPAQAEPPDKESFSGRHFLPEFSAISRAIAQTKAKGHMRHARSQKSRLERELKTLVDGKPWPERVKILSSWIVNLCREGTTHKRNLAFSTVYDYAFTVGRPLLELSGDSFLEFSDIEFEDFYLSALNYKRSRSDREFLVGRLYEFHGYLCEEYGVSDPDWSSIFEGAGPRVTRRISANVICPWEYEAALEAVLNDRVQSSRTRDQYALLLMLGYRWGLRFGEAYRLQWRNIQYVPDAGLCWIQVKNNIYGTVKREASVRQVPLTGSFAKDEMGVIERMIASCEEEALIEPQVALMHKEGQPRDLIERSDAEQYLNAVLRAVSGDSSVRFHHLRHSWAMRELVAGLLPMSPEGPWARMGRALSDDGRYSGGEQALWGESTSDARRLRAIAVALGHASEQTTLTSYTHVTDAYAAEFASNSPAPTSPALAYALQVSQATIRQRRRRIRLQKGKGSVPELRHLIMPSRGKNILPSPGVALAEQAWSGFGGETPAQLPPSLMAIERVLVLVGRRRGNTAGIPERLHMSGRDLKRILAAANQIEQRSGFESYRTILADDNLLLNQTRAQIEAPKEQNYRGTKRLRLWLFDLSKQLETLDQDQLGSLLAGLSAWCRAYVPSVQAPRFENLHDAERYMEAFHLLNLNLKWIAKCPRSAAEQIEGWASERGIDVEVSERQNSPIVRGRLRRSAWLLIRPAALPDEIVTLDTFLRGLMISMIWTQLRLGNSGPIASEIEE